jgi:hypothetical protein
MAPAACFAIKGFASRLFSLTLCAIGASRMRNGLFQ